jgi:glycosyltransferase involved in cell wall biosynthesis
MSVARGSKEDPCATGGTHLTMDIRPETGRLEAVRGCRVVATSMTARLLLANQLRSLDEMSWTVVSGDSFEDAPENVSVEIVPLRRELALSDLRSFSDLYRLFRRRRFDFVQTHTPKPSLLGLPAARLAGSKAIYTIHGALYFSDNSRLANIAGWLFEKWCCSWAHLVLVQSREDQEVLPSARICKKQKLRYIGNGVLLDRFGEDVEPAMTSELPVVMMISRLVKEKGCDDFLELARQLQGKARFVHVGPTESDQRDAVTADEIARASGYVDFVGEVSDTRSYMSAADLVVLPSYREGIPRAAMEAAAAGRPVVAYDVRGVREVIDPSAGLLVKRGDLEALRHLVSTLVDDPERLRSLGERCRVHVVERFSEQDVIERLRETYSEMADGRPS